MEELSTYRLSQGEALVLTELNQGLKAAKSNNRLHRIFGSISMGKCFTVQDRFQEQWKRHGD